MKRILLTTTIVLVSIFNALAQVGIGTTSPDSSSILHLNATNRGILIPRLTATQKNAISAPANGLLIYQTDSTPGFRYYNISKWESLGNTTQPWTSLGKAIYQNDTTQKVGIGTSSPKANLDVNLLAPDSAVNNFTVGSGPAVITIQGRYGYVINHYNSTMQVLDLNNPSNPVIISTVSTAAYPVALCVQGQYAYVTSYTWNLMQVFDISNPQSPILKGTVGTASVPRHIFVKGQYVYIVGLGSHVLQIADVSNPNSPRIVSTVGTDNTPHSVIVQDKYAFVLNYGSNTLIAYDISNPFAPKVVGTLTTNYLPTFMSIQGSYAYISCIGASTMQVINISDPTAMTVASTIGTVYQPYAITVHGRYAYIASLGADSLDIIDVSDSGNPKGLGRVKAGDEPHWVFAQGRYVYVGNLKSASISIYDMGGVILPQLEASEVEAGNIVSRGNVTVHQNSDIRGSLAVGNNAFVNGELSLYGTAKFSVGKDTSADSTMVFTKGGSLGIGNRFVDSTAIVDMQSHSKGVLIPRMTLAERDSIAGPANGLLVYITDTLKGFWYFKDSIWTSIAGGTQPWTKTGTKIYQTDTTNDVGLGTTIPKTRLHVPPQLDTTAIGSVATGTNAFGLCIQGNKAYVCINNTSSIKIFDISNPASLTLLSTTSTGTEPNDIEVRGKYAYTCDRWEGKIRVHDISNSNAIKVIGTATVGSYPVAIAVSGNYVYTANSGSNNLSVVDISNPNAPITIKTLSCGSYPFDVYVYQNFLYVVNGGSYTLQIFDISNPISPILKSTTSTGKDPTSVFVRGNFAFITNSSSNTLQSFNISNPTAPSLVSIVSTGKTPYEVVISGNYAFVSNAFSDNIQMFNISNPASMVKEVQVSTGSGSYPAKLSVVGRYIYVSNLGGTLKAFEIKGGLFGNLETGELQTSNLNVLGNVVAGNNMEIKGGLNVENHAQIGGNFGVYGSVSFSTDKNTTLDSTLLFTSNGKVGIGVNPTSTSYKFQVNGQPAANGYTAFTNYSDVRLKENVTTLGSTLQKIMLLKPVEFNYNSLAGLDMESQKRRIKGFLAQDVLKVFPEMIGTTTINGDEYYDLNLSHLQVYLVKAMQEQQVLIENLQRQNEELIKRMEALEKK